MPYYSLINSKNDRVIQIVDAPYKKFDVHSTFYWVDGPDTVEVGADYHYDTVTKTVVKTIYPALDYDVARRSQYDTFSDQLDQLWHDIDKGVIPGKDTSEWYLKIKAIKQANPKP